MNRQAIHLDIRVLSWNHHINLYLSNISCIPLTCSSSSSGIQGSRLLVKHLNTRVSWNDQINLYFLKKFMYSETQQFKISIQKSPVMINRLHVMKQGNNLATRIFIKHWCRRSDDTKEHQQKTAHIRSITICGNFSACKGCQTRKDVYMFPDLLSLHIEHIMGPVENIPGIVVCGFIIIFFFKKNSRYADSTSCQQQEAESRECDRYNSCRK